MNAANSPTKHHYIPAFYLRRWVGPDGKVTEFTKPYRDIVVKSIVPERTGYQERLYELMGCEPNLAQQVEEKFFKPIGMVTTRRGIRTVDPPGLASSFRCSCAAPKISLSSGNGGMQISARPTRLPRRGIALRVRMATPRRLPDSGRASHGA